ncbi:unnamed protein product [Symbiodinium pilosum]|uniref:Uncharacterized protein n=1 Tax=Symbiodinium pilosum TaxID=2952 RepID=A0A812X4J9_SYMPI|nr:unnamed protein product [Symbiodinium pilosum]
MAFRMLLGVAVATALREDKVSQSLEADTDVSQFMEYQLELDELEKLSDTPLFYTEKGGIFATAAQLLAQDSSSVLSRLEAGLKAGSNIVVVGAGGAGKTETILLAMENTRKSKASFDLRGWYLKKRQIDKKAYTTAVKADQLALLKSSESEVKAEIAGKSADVLFFDEVDLSENVMNGDELEAMKTLLLWGNEVAPKKTKIIVLHPLASVQPEVQELLIPLGFPGRGSSAWIDFSQPYSPAVEEAMVRGILSACEPAPTDAQVKEVQQYFLGLPSAYMPFLVNKDHVLDGLPASAADAIENVLKPTALSKIGGRLIKINIGFSATHEAREVVAKLRHNSEEKVSSADAAGAVASMVVEQRGAHFVIPPVMLDALNAFCTDMDDKSKKIVAAAAAAADEGSFSSSCSGVLTKLKRGVAEVKKTPSLLDEVPSDVDAWPFLLRVSSEKAAFAKQIWETAATLLWSPAWATSFQQQEEKSRLGIHKAGARDAAMVAELAARIVGQGTELGDLIPLEAIPGMERATCVALLGVLKEPSVPADVAEVGRAGRVHGRRGGQAQSGGS